MEFEFDPEKDALNEERHGIDFLAAQELWAAPNIIIPAREVSGEKREAILGRIDGKVYVAIFACRGARIRLISCHRADERLERIYVRKVEERES